MNILDLIPLPIEAKRKYAIVFSKDLANQLSEQHSHYGSPNCVPVPQEMIDDRVFLCADILSEIEPNGLLYDLWQILDKDIIINNVEIVSWNEAVDLIKESEFS